MSECTQQSQEPPRFHIYAHQHVSTSIFFYHTKKKHKCAISYDQAQHKHCHVWKGISPWQPGTAPAKAAGKHWTLKQPHWCSTRQMSPFHLPLQCQWHLQQLWTVLHQRCSCCQGLLTSCWMEVILMANGLQAPVPTIVSAIAFELTWVYTYIHTCA
jgi:hypothetical protein